MVNLVSVTSSKVNNRR